MDYEITLGNFDYGEVEPVVEGEIKNGLNKLLSAYKLYSSKPNSLVIAELSSDSLPRHLVFTLTPKEGSDISRIFLERPDLTESIGKICQVTPSERLTIINIRDGYSYVVNLHSKD